MSKKTQKTAHELISSLDHEGEKNRAFFLACRAARAQAEEELTKEAASVCNALASHFDFDTEHWFDREISLGRALIRLLDAPKFRILDALNMLEANPTAAAWLRDGREIVTETEEALAREQAERDEATANLQREIDAKLAEQEKRRKESGIDALAQEVADLQAAMAQTNAAPR